MASSDTKALLFIEILIKKEVTKKRNFHMKLGLTATCKKRMTEATKRLGQRDTEVTTKIFFLYDSLLALKNSIETAIDVVADMIGIV